MQVLKYLIYVNGELVKTTTNKQVKETYFRCYTLRSFDVEIHKINLV